MKKGIIISAEKHFLSTSKDEVRDNEFKSIFGLALVHYKLCNKEEVYKLLDQMLKSEYFENAINNYDIGILYFLYDDYENAKNHTLKCGISGVDLLDWKELGYSVYITDKDLFHQENNKSINQLKQSIQAIKDNKGNWKYMSDDEKQEYISDFLKEVKDKENIEKLFKAKPKTNIDTFLVADYHGCSMFGCCMHGNTDNDI